MPSNSYTQQLYQSVREAKDLPLPDDVAQQHSQELIRFIKQEMDNHQGAISFRRYMEIVLYAPGLGYYAAGSAKLGEAGDFITAPEISTLFSFSLANAIMPALCSQDIILEVGAGRGRMAADMMLFLQSKNALPKEYWILELSADLRERQKETISNAVPDLIGRVKWLETLPENFNGVVVANELLDAMPVQLFRKNEVVNEVNVVYKDEKFFFETKSSHDERLLNRLDAIEAEAGMPFEQGYVSEVNFAAEDWIHSIAEKLQKGIIILIDYGFPQHEYYHAQRSQGTLMCHYRHRVHADPFVYPGLQDITAHVDFTAMADAGLASGLKVIGYTNQANFLMGAGLMELVAANNNADIKQQLDLATQIKKLTLPHEMGELFKVIGFSKNCDVVLPAFSFRDMREFL
ncbi:MAG: SAM-dependent methyltransferase [Gammaproteobacteria bacterium]|nr:SAM-dependent methyltransferase [Gammaproteobacteria bacterium]